MIDSLLLCPGTPSNVFVATPTDSLLLGGVEGSNPSLNDAARVILGTILGAAVDTTGIVSERLCPGTFSNVFFSCSLDGGVRGPT